MAKKNSNAGAWLAQLKKQGIKWIDLQFVDVLGALQHITLPINSVSESDFVDGIGKLDGSSIKGFKEIFESDMILMPDLSTAKVNPFETNTVRVYCNVHEAGGGPRFERDSRYVAEMAENELKKRGFEISYWGPEVEFFVFDSVKFNAATPYKGQSYEIESSEAAWHSDGKNYPVRFKEGYYPAQPVDSMHEYRKACSAILEDSFGINIEAHHHEVATAGQNEIDMHYLPLQQMADAVVTYKFVARNLAKQWNKIATFMPKPIYGDNASGMHVHQSIWTKGKNEFFDARDKYAEVSQTCRYYMAGIIEHARALSAIVAPTTNSYKRLVPGYEAPVYVAWSKRNRSAAIRVPVYYKENPASKRMEYRSPDPSANPYLAFSAMLAAGLDGIKRKLSCPDPVDENLYHLSPSKRKELGVTELPGSLGEALDELEADNGFLKPIFSDGLLEAYVSLKREESKQNALRPTPWEFQAYLDV